MAVVNVTDRMMELSHIHHNEPNRDCPICTPGRGGSLAEDNRRWWENKVTELVRSVMAAEQAGDTFLALAERTALSDARKKFAEAICNG